MTVIDRPEDVLPPPTGPAAPHPNPQHDPNAPAGERWSLWLENVREVLPRGSRLSDEAFRERHQIVAFALVILIATLTVVGLVVGEGIGHVALEMLPIIIPGVVGWRSSTRTLAALAMSFAVMMCSSTLVHQTGGLIEAHFLFFVLLPLVALYQDWRAFLGSITFVVFSHMVVGTLQPESMYNHPAAINNPVKWAFIHAVFVVGLVIVLIVEWRLAEREQRRTTHALANLQQTQAMLFQAQKLESVGQLAAGVAHEINTPVQYLSDNAVFLRESVQSLLETFELLAELASETDNERVEACLEEADIDFLREEIPGALEHSQDGLQRVSEIVRAMKDFSHPGKERSDVDLNRAIESTSTVSRNEWKYVADLQLELDPDLPLVPSHAGQIKQVVLNLIVNAAHAIGDGRIDISAVSETGVVPENPMGTIVVRTGVVGDHARITVTDTGCGMTAETTERIFEQFFTTKEVGRGTGQGLSMVHRIIDAHHGLIDVESIVGVGTTFIVDLPLSNPVSEEDDER